jgi:hypothetical protein
MSMCSYLKPQSTEQSVGFLRSHEELSSRQKLTRTQAQASVVQYHLISEANPKLLISSGLPAWSQAMWILTWSHLLKPAWNKVKNRTWLPQSNCTRLRRAFTSYPKLRSDLVSVIGIAEFFIWRTVQCDDAAQNEMRQGCSLAGHRTSRHITECMPLMEHSSCFKEPCRVKSTKLETLRLP